MDSKTTLDELKKRVEEFCEIRDWDQFHNIKDLSIALSIESSELLEIFRWKTKEEIVELINNKNKIEDVEDELADILYFLLRIAQINNIDLTKSLIKKLEKNEKKYPIEKSKGSNKKYNEF